MSHIVLEQLGKDYPQLEFRHRKSISKKEINNALQKIDPQLGQTLFIENGEYEYVVKRNCELIVRKGGKEVLRQSS